MALWRGVLEALVPVVGYEVGVSLHALVHFVTDDVHETLKDLLDVDVVLRTGIEELETCKMVKVREQNFMLFTLDERQMTCGCMKEGLRTHKQIATICIPSGNGKFLTKLIS